MAYGLASDSLGGFFLTWCVRVRVGVWLRVRVRARVRVTARIRDRM